MFIVSTLISKYLSIYYNEARIMRFKINLTQNCRKASYYDSIEYSPAVLSVFKHPLFMSDLFSSTSPESAASSLTWSVLVYLPIAERKFYQPHKSIMFLFSEKDDARGRPCIPDIILIRPGEWSFLQNVLYQDSVILINHYEEINTLGVNLFI